MKAANLLLFSLVSILAQSSCLAQSDDIAVKSRRAKELMAEGRFVQAVPLYRELNQAVPNNPGLLLNLGMALHMPAAKSRHGAAYGRGRAQIDTATGSCGEA